MGSASSCPTAKTPTTARARALPSPHRGARKIKDATALDLDGQFGLHPALAPLLPLWESGELRFVVGAALPKRLRISSLLARSIRRSPQGWGRAHW